MKARPRLVIFALTVIAIFTMIAFFAKDVEKNMTLGLDLQGGFEIVYEVSPLEVGNELPSMAAVARSVSKRIDVLGVSEPEIVIEGNNRIRVQLAGVSDQEQARRIISATANLTFRDVDDNLLADASILTEGGASLGFENGVPVVSLKIADQNKFFELTEKVSKMGAGKNFIVTWLDFEEGDSYDAEKDKEVTGQQKYISAATVSAGIKGDAIIKGSFSDAEARELADLINSGSLPVKMAELYSNVVSAEFGIAAFNQTLFAGIIGIFLVMAAMIIVYKLPGIVSAIMLFLYVFVVLFLYNSMGGVFTLPGIAALVLGVGMTVDANIITFERIKDELYLGRTLEKAYVEGHELAFWTIFDSQFTTFIAALIMYILGTGAVKGFATMLMVTVFVTVVLNVYFTKFLLGLLVRSKFFNNKKGLFGVKPSNIPDVTKGENQKYFGPFTKIDFVKQSKKFLIGSATILILGLSLFTINSFRGIGGMNLGIDFSSGTKITMQSDIPLTLDEIRTDFAQFGYDSIAVQFAGDDIAYVTTSETETTENLRALKVFIEDKYGFEANDVVVTPVVGRELVINAFVLSMLAWVMMMIYITLRFEWDYAMGTIVSLLHDIFIVFAVFVIFRVEINTEFIAVILAIIGYSVDDSIVVFDRIRDSVNHWPKPHISKSDYRQIVNKSLQVTLWRSFFNTFTTILPIFALISFGSSEIFEFNLAMLVGLVAGAYSSIFIAAQLWYYIRVNKKPQSQKSKKPRKKEALDEVTIIGIND
ncbi:MAG: protein translocase subunit SecD [Erysipelotrichaceae bacterium]|nr:protein translocase subunit SecD [Erysipelotrichaceae bacterium]